MSFQRDLLKGMRVHTESIRSYPNRPWRTSVKSNYGVVHVVSIWRGHKLAMCNHTVVLADGPNDKAPSCQACIRILKQHDLWEE